MSDERRGQEKRNARQNKKWRKNVGNNRIEWLNSMRQMDANRCNGEDDNRQKLSNEIEFGRRVRTKRNEWMKNVHGDFVRLSNSNPTDTKWQRQCFNEVYRKYVAFSLPFRFFFFFCRHLTLSSCRFSSSFSRVCICYASFAIYAASAGVVAFVFVFGSLVCAVCLRLHFESAGWKTGSTTTSSVIVCKHLSRVSVRLFSMFWRRWQQNQETRNLVRNESSVNMCENTCHRKVPWKWKFDTNIANRQWLQNVKNVQSSAKKKTASDDDKEEVEMESNERELSSQPK